MPDFERLMDSAFTHAAPDEATRQWWSGYVEGKTAARREVAVLAAVVALVWVAVAGLLP